MQSGPLCHRLSKTLKVIKIWHLKMGQNKDLVFYRKKQSFRQCAWRLRKLVLKPGFRPKGRALGMKEKSKNSTASDQYFLSYVKKIQGGGKLTPTPPAEIGLTWRRVTWNYREILKKVHIGCVNLYENHFFFFQKLITRYAFLELACWENMIFRGNLLIFSGKL